MECSQSKDRIQLALNAFKNGQFKTKKSASLAFDVPETTLRRQLQGVASCSEKAANCQKLSNTGESTLLSWILDMDKCGLPLQLSTIHHLAQLLVSARHGSSQPVTIGESWVNSNCYIQRHPELKSKYILCLLDSRRCAFLAGIEMNNRQHFSHHACRDVCLQWA